MAGWHCWLQEGENHVGAPPSSQVVLHGHDIPPRVGSMWLEDGRVRFVPHEGVDLPETTLRDDRDGDPTVLELSSLRFHLIKRGERIIASSGGHQLLHERRVDH